jgi:hypothetical protein
MPRSLDTAFAAELATAKNLFPIFFVDLPINNQVLHIWSGVGTFEWNGNEYVGVGQLGSITPAAETTDISAQGAALTLSGVNNQDAVDAESDVQLGARCTIWWSIVNPATLALIGQPVAFFAGVVDVPSIATGAEQGSDGTPGTSTITIPLESRLATLGSGQQRKYSRADQNLKFPTDTAFNWVSLNNYLALKWQPGGIF